MASVASLDRIHRTISAAVDAGFYRAVYPDLDAGLDPVAHYADAGWREGRDPAPWFSTADYLRENDDVAQAALNPLFHFLTEGRFEGRDAPPSRHARTYRADKGGRREIAPWTFETGPRPVRAVAPPVLRTVLAAPPSASDQALAATQFDADFYLSTNPDVARAGADPLGHFLSFGWREGRDPTPRFSVRDYLENYADVADAEINPFVHYLRSGHAEGRSPKNDLGFRYEVIARLRPLAARIADVEACDEGPPTSAEALARTLADGRTGLRDLHVTFSHDNYAANVGGLQLCLQRESARFQALGRDHLHLYPAKPWPVVRVETEACGLGVVLNGRALGVARADDVVRALRQATDGLAPGARSFAVHSLLGHRADEVAAILGAVGLRQGFFWLHDFASLCAGFHLLRDDVADCGAPPPGSPACRVCVYGPYRSRHLDQHARLFESLDLTVVAPSEPALDTWRRGGSYPTRGEVVLPHANLVERPAAPLAAADGPLRLVFLGAPTAHKGWPIFRELAVKHAEDSRYVFMHLASETIRGLPIAFERVAVSAERPHAMRDALEALQVDAALIWSLCRETFSFTAYEAAAAGAAILTGPDSGNVAAFVEASGLGRVLPDERALEALLVSGEIFELARVRRRPARYDLSFSNLTVDLLEKAARP